MTDNAILYLKVGATDSGNYELVAAEQIGVTTYLLIETPIQSCGLNYGTTVNAELNADNELEVTSIAAPSAYSTRQFIRTSSLSTRQLNENIASKVIAAGGHWEMASAGLAFVHLRKDSFFDLDELFDQNNYHPLEISIASKRVYQPIISAA